MRSYHFHHVDVFTERPLGGNPLAVFLDPAGLSDAEMQAIARELNLSETTFVLSPKRPDCAARIRIFTPGSELPFAGHPTVGTAWVLARAGRLPPGTQAFALEAGIGPVPLTLDGPPSEPRFIWMRHQDAVFGPRYDDQTAVAAALRLTTDDLLPDVPAEMGSTGNRFLFVALRDRAAVDRASLDEAMVDSLLGDQRGTGIFLFALDAPDGSRVYSRMLASRDTGIREDPATGSASGPLGAYLVRHGLTPAAPELAIVSEQGTAMGRQSFIHLRLRVIEGQPTAIEVGGSVVPIIEGELHLPD